ncbi:MAG TPA: hypothetical protein VK206_04160 [Anaerolineales bacterium]|nr:hypothetical protein [Anaerolineales bacterium]HLO29694.1 hypothetical protein [Anaerolineales bacterium]
MPLQGIALALCKGLVGGTRPRHVDGTNFKPRRLLDCPQGVRRVPPPHLQCTRLPDLLVQSGASVAWRTLPGIGGTLC